MDGGRRSRSASPTPTSMPTRLTCGPAKYDSSRRQPVRSETKLVITGSSSRTSSRDSTTTLEACLSSQPQTQRSESRVCQGTAPMSASPAVQKCSAAVPVPVVAVKALQPSVRVVSSWVPPGSPALSNNALAAAVAMPSPRARSPSPTLSLAAPPSQKQTKQCFSFGTLPAAPVSFQPPRLHAEPRRASRSASPFPAQAVVHVQGSMRSATPPPCATYAGDSVRPVARPSLACAGLFGTPRRAGPFPPVWNLRETSPAMVARASPGWISSV